MERNSKYSEKKYWEERFETEEEFEWLGGFRRYEGIFRELLRPEDKILILGCGTSRLGLDLSDAGFRGITNMDYVEALIEKMKKLHSKSYGDVKWVTGDMRSLKELFPSESFDVILEKGTLDAILAKEPNPWSLSEESSRDLSGTISGISECLTASGLFISVSFAQPHFRIPLYAKKELNWSLSVSPVGSTEFSYFLYKMRKGERLDEECLQGYLYPLRSAQAANQSICLEEDAESPSEMLAHIQL